MLQDPVNGAQKAGSWAVRETFVAVVTSNLPMILPLIALCCRPLMGTLRSASTRANKLVESSRSRDGRGRAWISEDRNPRRGMGPRSVNPIPNFSVNGSEENIVRADDADLEAGLPVGGASAREPARSGVILKKTSLEIIEMRRIGELEEERDVADYYLVRQQQDSEILVVGRKNSVGRRDRTRPLG